MSWRGLSVLAVVPARGQSRGIPGKNLCRVGGVSLVARAAKIALSLPWVDTAIISTDDPEIAAEATAYGLDCPFMRPPELASDTSTAVDAWRHAWLTSEAYYARSFQLSVWLEPTSPLRRAEDVEMTLACLVDEKRLAAVTVSPTPAHYTPHKSLMIDDSGNTEFYMPDGARYSLRQKIPRLYHRNGLCYAATRETVVDRGQILEEGCAAVVIHRPVANIDEPFDLELAEWLWTRSRNSDAG